MVRVGVPLLHGAALSHVFLPADALGGRRVGPRGTSEFVVEFVGLDNDAVRYGPAIVTPHRTTRARSRFDLVMVPSLGFDVASGLRANKGFVPWLRRLSSSGAVLASWCTGAFLLAEAGLLDGSRATTHWATASEFARRYPAVHLDVAQMLVDEGRIITAGGATTAYLLILHLIERYVGPGPALEAAREYVADRRRPAQRAYVDHRIYESHSDPVVRQIQDYVADHLAEAFSLSRLAAKAGTSTKSLSRRFKAATGIAPITYVQHARIEAAKKALLNSTTSVEIITLQVGYADPRAFRRLFKRSTGLSPRLYRTTFGLARV